MASIRTSPLAMQLQDLDRLLDEADGKLETVRFAVARSQRLHSRLRQFVADTKEAFEQGQARPLGPQELDALRNTVQATTQLFNMLSKISIYDYFVATNRWNTDVLTLSSNVGIMRRQSGVGYLR